MSPADHAAWISARATVWAAAFSGVSMVGVLWGAYVATRAARTWRGVHEAAAADQCVATASECVNAVDRVISMRWYFHGVVHPVSREAMVFPDEAYNEVWAVWRHFRVAYVVASRYYADRIPTDVPDRIAEHLADLEAWCCTFYGAFPGDPPGTDVNQRLVANRRSDEIRAAVGDQVNRVTEALRPEPPRAPLWPRMRARLSRGWTSVRQP